MEKSSKRGKIPQQDWPSIITRYESGETLASIARTYDCSPPAISYIVSRTRARNAAAEPVPLHDTPAAPAAPAEPQLIKTPTPPVRPASVAAGEAAPAASRDVAAFPIAAASSEAIAPGRLVQSQAPRDPPQTGNGFAKPRSADPAGAARTDGEPRRTLHLSLPFGDAAAPVSEAPPPPPPSPANPGYDRDGHPARQAPATHVGPVQHPHPAPPHASSFGAPSSPLGAMGGPLRHSGEVSRPQDRSTFIDHALRERIDADIAAFLAAFDAALDHDTPESRTELREATDRLLRAGARTRIELERLEARVPLPARDKNPQATLFRSR